MRYVIAALLIACGASPASLVHREAPAAGRGALALPRSSGSVSAYRHVVRFEGHDESGPWIEERHGILYLEPDRDGRLHVTYEDDGEELRPLPIDDRAAIDLYFPAYERTIAAGGLERRWEVPTMAPLPDSPFILSERLFAARGRSGVMVDFERDGVVAAGTPMAVHVHQSGQGDYDAEHQHYERVVVDTQSTVQANGREVRAHAELTFDPAATLARVDARQRIAEAERDGAREHDAFADWNDGDAEIATIENLLAEADEDPDTTELEAFHARANPEAMWRVLIDLPLGPGRDHLVQLLAIDPAMRGEHFPDEVVPMIRARIFDDGELAELVMMLGDERFRPELERIARTGPGTLRERARAVLEQMEARTPTLAELESVRADEERWLAGVEAYIAEVDDPRSVVPGLLAIVARPAEDRWLAMRAIVLLQQITCRAIADDPAAWASLYDRYRDRPYREWLLDASYDSDRIARLAAAVALTERGDDAGRARLRELAADRDPITRFVAAEALAAEGDAAGLPQILAMMRDPARATRRIAYLALAYLAPCTFGFDPDAPALERARALGRIERWAAR